MEMPHTGPFVGCFLGNLLHCLTFLTRKCLPYIQLEFPLFQFIIIVSFSLTMILSKEPGSIFSLTSHEVLDSC